MPIPPVPPVLAAGGTAGVVLDLLLVLGASAFAVLVLARVGISAIPAMLLTGALIGPHALGLVPAPGALGGIAQLAIVVLLFGVGLELHLDALRPGAARLLTAGLVACLGCVAVLWPIAALVLDSGMRGLVVAMVFALSSTAVVLKLFARRRELTQPSGRFALAILVVQDLAVIGMLALLPLLARMSGAEGMAEPPPGPLQGPWGLLLRVAGVSVLVLVGRAVLPRILREALRAGGAEALFLAGMAAALGAAAACQGLGFSLELGAFLAGFLLADSPFQQELSAQVAPVRDLFLAVFFTTLGMAVDPAATLAAWPWVLLGLVLLVVLKGLVTSFACWVSGAHASTALVVGLSLAHGGEFSLVLLEQAAARGLLADELHGILVSIVVLGLLGMPALAALGRRLAPALHAVPSAPRPGQGPLVAVYGRPADAAAGPAPVIVGGYGPVGRAVARALREAGETVVIVDFNPETVAALQRNGRAAILGDLRTEAVLQAAGLEHARALVLTVPDAEAAQRTLHVARRTRPDLWLAARAPLASAEPDLRAAGAQLVLSDETSVGSLLARTVLASLPPATPPAPRS